MPPPTPPLSKISHALVFLEHAGLGIVVFHSPKPTGEVVPASDGVVACSALAHISEALFAKRFRELIARLEVGSHGSGKTVSCPLKEKASSTT